MRKLDKKIISIFLVLIMIISQLGVVFAANTTETKITLEEYLIKNNVDANSDGKLSDSEWKKVKNLTIDGEEITITNIEKATNLEELIITGINPSKINFSKFPNLEFLSIDTWGLPVNTKIDFTLPNMSKLKYLRISGDLGYDGDNWVYAFNNIDISKLSVLENITIWDENATIKFPSLENLKSIDLDVNDSKIDFSKCTKLEYGYLYRIESLDNIIFPENYYISCDEENGWADIINIEDISIRKGTTYEFYDKEPICKKNNIIDLSYNEYSGNYEILAKNVGTQKIKFIDSLYNEIEVNVTVFENNPDKTLEKTGVTAEAIEYGEAILKSNGELWKVNSETTAEKVATNVKKYVSSYVYANEEFAVGIESILKNDNNLTVKLEDDAQKNISNVKDVNDNLYLTTTGDLYEFGVNYITEEIIPKKIKSNVKMITDECIVLNDGTTWYQELDSYYYKTNGVTLKKLANFEIKASGLVEYEYEDGEDHYYTHVMSIVDLNDTLWCCKEKDYRFNNSGLDVLQENFAGYEKILDNGWNLILEDGKAVLKTEEYNPDTGEWEIISSEVILTDVYQIHYNYWADIIIRTDGSIWLYDTVMGLTKVTKSTVVDEDKEENKEEKLPFTDVSKDAWYYNAVKFNYEKGMIKGTSDTTFDPNGDLTRGMLVTILWRMEGNPKVTTNQFTDVGKDVWYSTAVNWAANNRIVSGYGNGKFGPNDKITREQLAVMLRNYAIYKKKDVSARTDLSKFADNKYISSYAKDAVSWAVANKIISGKSEGTRVDPHGKATRAEAAAMLYNYCMNIK